MSLSALAILLHPFHKSVLSINERYKCITNSCDQAQKGYHLSFEQQESQETLCKKLETSNSSLLMQVAHNSLLSNYNE